MTGLDAFVETLCARRAVRAEDVHALRQSGFGAAGVTEPEAETLLAVEEAMDWSCPEWHDFFLEVLTDYVVCQQQPSGYVDNAKADWLVRRLAAGGRLNTATELELLVRVMEAADSAPAKLSVLVIHQVRRAVLGDDGALERAEVELVRRVLFALGGQGGRGVSVIEAEALFDLNDAARGRPNDPSWTDLFARAVGAAVLAASGYAAPTREDSLRRGALLEASIEGLRSIFLRMTGAVASTLRGPAAIDRDDVDEDEDGGWEMEPAVAARVIRGEARWLIHRIGREGALDDNEKALLRFLEAAQPELRPELRPLLDRAA